MKKLMKNKTYQLKLLTQWIYFEKSLLSRHLRVLKAQRWKMEKIPDFEKIKIYEVDFCFHECNHDSCKHRG